MDTEYNCPEMDIGYECPEMDIGYECPICIETFSTAEIEKAKNNQSEILKETLCKHLFCVKCFDSSSKHNNICPLCRGKMIEGDQKNIQGNIHDYSYYDPHPNLYHDINEYGNFPDDLDVPDECWQDLEIDPNKPVTRNLLLDKLPEYLNKGPTQYSSSNMTGIIKILDLNQHVSLICKEFDNCTESIALMALVTVNADSVDDAIKLLQKYTG